MNDEEKKEVAINSTEIKWIKYEITEYKKESIKLLEEIKQETKKTNGRVTELERWRDKLSGMVVGIGMIAGIIASFVAWVVTWMFKLLVGG